MYGAHLVEAVSSLKINPGMPEFFLVGAVLNISLRLSANFKERMIWNPILEVER